MPLARLVDASNRAAPPPGRIAKRDAIAAVLRGADGDEVEVAVAFLSGEIRQGRIGIGWATLAALRVTPAAEPQLTLRDVDAALAEVAATAGKGSPAARSARLGALFARATAAEQDLGWLSNLHLGARDPAGSVVPGGWVMLGKIFKGMTDALLEWQTTEPLPRETHRDGNTVWVKPDLVVEIAFNDLQESPQYPGGLALRFARVTGYRSDERAEEADAIATIKALYAAQMSRGPA